MGFKQPFGLESAKLNPNGYLAMEATQVTTRSLLIPKRPSSFHGRALWGWLLLLIVGWSIWQTGLFQRDLVNEGGWELTWRFLQASVSPELNGDFLRLTAEATLVTLAYAMVGTAVSLLLGSVGAIFASEVWWEAVWGRNGRFFRLPITLIRALFALPRGIHELLWGLFFINIFGLDPLTAVLAIGIPFGAIIAKIFAETLDEMPRQPFLALINSGVPPFKALLYTLLPQALPDLLSYAFYRFECAIRAAAVLGIIGAGGLGYQILLSLQTLRYEEMWTLFFALFLLSGLADFWSTWLRRRLGRDGRTNSGAFSDKGQAVPQMDGVVRGSLWLMALLLPFSLWYVSPDWSKLWLPRTAVLWQEIAQATWPPSLTWAEIATLWQLSQETLAMSVLAAVIASVGGIGLAFLGANNLLLPGGVMDTARHDVSRWRWWLGTTVLTLTRFILLVLRAIPAPIWALVLLYVLFPGILPGALALAMYNLGVLGRLMAEIVENLDERPLRALKAQGAAKPQTFLYGVLPATMPRFVGYSLYRWEIAIRATFIVGLVGAGGLGRLLSQQLSRFDYRRVIITIAVYILLTFLVDLVSVTVRKSIR